MEENVAIIIVNYNGIKDTIECIKSVQKSTIKTDIFVVDNDSKGNEAKEIANFFKNVFVIESGYNGGFAAGNNIGIKEALKRDYEYIVLLNNDTIVDGNAIEYLVKNTKTNEVAVPCIYYYNTERISYAGGVISRYKGSVKTYVKKECKKKSNFVTGCCFSINKHTLKKVGLMREDFFMYYEDTDYSLRLLKNKVKINYVKEANIWHKEGASSGGEKSDISVYYGTRNRLKMIYDNREYFSFFAIPFTIVTRFIKYLLMKDKKKRKLYIKGIKAYYEEKDKERLYVQY